MLKSLDNVIGQEIELGTVEVTTAELRAYGAAVGDAVIETADAGQAAPLGFMLALRRGPQPDVDLLDGTVSVHAGHVITSRRPLIVPGAYVVRARLADVFEKNGRSGPLTVVVRQVDIGTADGAPVATVEDQQIVRWRRVNTEAGAARPANQTVPATPPAEIASFSRRADPTVPPDLDVGSEIEERCTAPDAPAIARYAGRLAGGESLFTDVRYARSLGYADVIVPGPLLSAMLERFLRRRYSGLALRRLAVTFRVSVIAAEPITLAAVVIEQRWHDAHMAIVCDLSIENSDGERAALGTAELTTTD